MSGMRHGRYSLRDGTQAPVRRTTREPKRHGNPFMVPTEVPAQPRSVPLQPATVPPAREQEAVPA